MSEYSDLLLYHNLLPVMECLNSREKSILNCSNSASTDCDAFLVALHQHSLEARDLRMALADPSLPQPSSVALPAPSLPQPQIFRRVLLGLSLSLRPFPTFPSVNTQPYYVRPSQGRFSQCLRQPRLSFFRSNEDGEMAARSQGVYAVFAGDAIALSSSLMASLFLVFLGHLQYRWLLVSLSLPAGLLDFPNRLFQGLYGPKLAPSRLATAMPSCPARAAPSTLS